MPVCWQIPDCLTIYSVLHFLPLVDQAMCLYGDPAYPLRIHLQAPFRNTVLTPAMEAFNSSMSAVRESVEWLFGDIVNYF